jgi:diaminohydroxyphosphoribosylaminopyrimidine deaminase/5-amino-6-(5-phosphoribosylamino)uracil reductase
MTSGGQIGSPVSADAQQASDDERYMAAALALGRRGLGRTRPNPSVGALVVKNGVIVGRGWTGDGGRPHGEIVALTEAGQAAHGATLYVTLEPCSHHGRTPPCCEAIVAAGIARLVYAIEDPNPQVAGQGASYCRTHGLAVTDNVGARAAYRDHLGHIRVMQAGRPMVTLKLAETADGFVAGGPYDSRLAITGVAANGAVHVMRAMHDAIMVGIGTILADDALLTVRLPGVTAKPLRIVLDATARTPTRSRLLATASDAPILLLVGEGAPWARVEALGAIANVELCFTPLAPDGRLDLAVALADLAKRGVTRVFSEGGPTVAAALIDKALVDDVLIFTAPRPLGSDGVATLNPASRRALADPNRFRLADTCMIGVDRLRHYESVD